MPLVTMASLAISFHASTASPCPPCPATAGGDAPAVGWEMPLATANSRARSAMTCFFMCSLCFLWSVVSALSQRGRRAAAAVAPAADGSRASVMCCDRM